MNDWTQLTTEVVSGTRSSFVRSILAVFDFSDEDERLGSNDFDERLAAAFKIGQQMGGPADRAWSEALVGVVGDLVQQGWTLVFRKGHLHGRRPLANMPREMLRQRLLVGRNEQLLKPSVREFISRMERWSLFRGARTSVLSLMRDGRLLAKSLTEGVSLSELIDPYLQFVTTEGTCELTGLRTLDIWRYFRHTWSTPYESVPGRSLPLLVRDRAAPFHPVIGIAALSSAAVRLGPRDRFIGWDTEQVIEQLQRAEDGSALLWAQRVLANALEEIYRVDFIGDGLIPADQSKWTLETARACAKAGVAAKEQHHRLMEAKTYKAHDDVSNEEACVARARLYLFRAKRASELAKLIPMVLQLKSGLPVGGEGREFLSKVVRIARSKTVGTEIADLTVCGAVAPYSHLAAGKLVAMLSVTPEVIAEYKRRYSGVPGIIASSMAGRPVRRESNLVYVGTTSLYGRRPNQYDRLAMPAGIVGGPNAEAIKFVYVRDEVESRTQGIGTFHFSSRTLKAMERLVQSGNSGWKANNVFGEGTSPKLRGLRDGLQELGLDAEELLVHGIERCMYGVKLARNVDRYLLGMDEQPEWVVDPGRETVADVSRWWLSRWASPRATRADVRSAIEREGLAYPIRHHARVQLPQTDEGQSVMF